MYTKSCWIELMWFNYSLKCFTIVFRSCFIKLFWCLVLLELLQMYNVESIRTLMCVQVCSKIISWACFCSLQVLGSQKTTGQEAKGSAISCWTVHENDICSGNIKKKQPVIQNLINVTVPFPVHFYQLRYDSDWHSSSVIQYLQLTTK